MPSVCILSAAWRRFAVTRLVLAQRQRLCDELAARGMDAVSLIVADDENLDIASEYGCQTIEAPNAPLGGKWNIGLRAAAATGADFVVWIGSDDWIHPDAFDPLLNLATDTPPVIVTGRQVAVVNVRTGMLQRVKSPSQYGAIPWMINSRLLRGSRGPLPDGADRGLDGALVRGIRLNRIPFGWEWHDPHAFRCVDFKTEINITPYDGIARNLGVGDAVPAWDELEGWFPSDLVQQARTMLVPHDDSKRKAEQAMKLIHPETGKAMSVSRAGYDVLRKRGWLVPDEQSAPTAKVETSGWPDTHAGLDAAAESLSVTWPAPPEGKKKLTVAQKIEALEAAGHTPPEA